MGRAAENFNQVNFKDESGKFIPYSNPYFNVLRHIFWNLIDGHAFVREGPKCSYSIESWGRRCYLVEMNRETRRTRRYEIVNCTYSQLKSKIFKEHEE